MNIPEEFGSYLLLKKLAEDPLGETFRAGKAGKGGLEQVVLLRVFNGKGLDGEALWQKISGRAAVQQALRSPNIGSGVDIGRVRSYPYVAYDYISGKNLATLLAQSTKQGSPIPADHALLIAERVALALAVASESRVGDERVLHGFVVPQLVMVSNEGETRLLGFEAAPGLRAAASPDLARYLAPEAAAGAPVSRADDVWSLGVLLYELLTGERLPVPSPDGYGAALKAASLPHEGGPLPPAVVTLLEKSLVPKDARVPDAVAWHKAISKLMIDGHLSPTTFNLAFFMHNLFRDEIERESQELQAEKKLDVAPKAAPPPPRPAAPAPVVDMRESTGVRQGTLPGVAVAAEAQGGSKKGLFIGVAAAALVAVGVGTWLAFGRGGSEPAPPPPAVTAPAPDPAVLPVATADTAGAEVPAGPTPEEIQSQISAMVAASSKEMEAKLKQQYDDRIKTLQQQLEESRRIEERPRSSPPAPSPAPAEPLPTAAETRTASRPIEAAPPPVPAPQQAVAPQTEARETSPPVPTPERQAPDQTTAAPAKPAPAPEQKVRVGDIIGQGAPGSTPPQLVRRPEPRYPAGARRISKAAQVDIKLLVDENGQVASAERIGVKAGFGFDEAALEAVRRSVYRPATKDGVRVKMWTTVRIAFKPQ